MHIRNYIMMNKKDILVVFINLLVLSSIVYIYYIVEPIITMLSNKSLSTSNTDAVYFEGSEINKNLHIRQSRSISSIKLHNFFLYSLAQPNIDFEQNGILGPWILSNKSLSVDSYHPIKLTSRRTLLEIVDEGLYLVHIQVYYLSSSKKNSFTMTKIMAGINETLSVCSTLGTHGTEISCFTSIVEYFKPGESILIRLREMSSSINLNRKISHTYLSFTKL